MIEHRLIDEIGGTTAIGGLWLDILRCRGQSNRLARQSSAGRRSAASQRAYRLSAPRRTRLDSASPVGTALRGDDV
jgi:hypothetical protein